MDLSRLWNPSDQGSSLADVPTLSFIAIIDFSPQVRWLYVTESISDMLGWEPHEVIGRSTLEIVKPDEARTVRTNHHNTISQDKAANIVYLSLRHKDPAQGYIHCVVSRTVVHDVLVGSVSLALPGANAMRNASTASEVEVISQPERPEHFQFRRWNDPSPMPLSPTTTSRMAGLTSFPFQHRQPPGPASARKLQHRTKREDGDDDDDDDDDDDRLEQGVPMDDQDEDWDLNPRSVRTAFILDRFSSECPIMYATNERLLRPGPKPPRPQRASGPMADARAGFAGMSMSVGRAQGKNVSVAAAASPTTATGGQESADGNSLSSRLRPRRNTSIPTSSPVPPSTSPLPPKQQHRQPHAPTYSLPTPSSAPSIISRSFFSYVSPADEKLVRAWIDAVKAWGVNERGEPSDGGFGYGSFRVVRWGRQKERAGTRGSGRSARERGAEGGGSRGLRPSDAKRSSKARTRAATVGEGASGAGPSSAGGGTLHTLDARQANKRMSRSARPKPNLKPLSTVPVTASASTSGSGVGSSGGPYGLGRVILPRPAQDAQAQGQLLPPHVLLSPPTHPHQPHQTQNVLPPLQSYGQQQQQHPLHPGYQHPQVDHVQQVPVGYYSSSIPLSTNVDVAYSSRDVQIRSSVSATSSVSPQIQNRQQQQQQQMYSHSPHQVYTSPYNVGQTLGQQQQQQQMSSPTRQYRAEGGMSVSGSPPVQVTVGIATSHERAKERKAHVEQVDSGSYVRARAVEREAWERDQGDGEGEGLRYGQGGVGVGVGGGAGPSGGRLATSSPVLHTTSTRPPHAHGPSPPVGSSVSVGSSGGGVSATGDSESTTAVEYEDEDEEEYDEDEGDEDEDADAVRRRRQRRVLQQRRLQQQGRRGVGAGADGGSVDGETGGDGDDEMEMEMGVEGARRRGSMSTSTTSRKHAREEDEDEEEIGVQEPSSMVYKREEEEEELGTASARSRLPIQDPSVSTSAAPLPPPPQLEDSGMLGLDDMDMLDVMDEDEDEEEFTVDAIFSAHSDGLLVILRRAM